MSYGAKILLDSISPFVETQPFPVSGLVHGVDGVGTVEEVGERVWPVVKRVLRMDDSEAVNSW